MVVRLRPHNLVAMASPSAPTYEIKAADAFESKLSERVCLPVENRTAYHAAAAGGPESIPVLAAHVIQKFGGKMLPGKCEAFSLGHGAPR